MKALELTRWQRRRLERQLKWAQTPRLFRRTMAVLEVDRGKSVAEIAESLRVTRQSVYNWIEAYCQSHNPEALLEGRHPGRPSAWNGENQALLRCLMQQRPDECGYYAVNWTAPLLKQQMECTTSLPFSQDMIREELRNLGYVWKRGRYELLPDPELEKKTSDSPANPPFAASDCVAGRR